MAERQDSLPSAASGSPNRPKPSPQEQETGPSQQSRHLDLQGWLAHRAGPIPPPPFPGDGTLIRPTPRNPQPPRLPGTAFGTQLAQQILSPPGIGVWSGPSQATLLEELEAHRQAGAAVPPLPLLSLPPYNSAQARSTAIPSALATGREPSASSRERTPATPIPRQLSGLANPLDAWETPPRRSRYTPSSANGLMNLAAAAETESQSQSLPRESTGNRNLSATTPRARTSGARGTMGLPDRTRSVTSARPQPTKRAASLPSRRRRQPSAAAARGGASAAQSVRPLSSTGPEDDTQLRMHPGQVRLVALEMFDQGSSYETIAQHLGIEVSQITTWRKDLRRGPRIPGTKSRKSSGSQLQPPIAAAHRFPSDATHEPKREQAMAMFESGADFATVRETLGIPSVTLINWRHAAQGIEPRSVAQQQPRQSEEAGDSQATVSEGTVTDDSFDDPRSPSSGVGRQSESAARAPFPSDSGGRGSGGRGGPRRAESGPAGDSDWGRASALGASAAGAASMPATMLPSPPKPIKKSDERRIRFSAEVRAEALRLSDQGRSSGQVAEALSRHGVKPHNVLNWVSLKRKGKMNDRGDRYYAKNGWCVTSKGTGTGTGLGVRDGEESDSKEDGEISP